MTEEEILDRYSNPRLRRNILTREVVKLNMEFDSQYSGWTPDERDAFLDALFPETVDASSD